MQSLGVKSRVVRATFRAINPRFLGARGWKPSQLQPAELQHYPEGLSCRCDGPWACQGGGSVFRDVLLGLDSQAAH